jgi:hypothetical protein
MLDRHFRFQLLVGPLFFILIISQFLNFSSKDYYGSDYIENSFYSTYINPQSEISNSFQNYYQTDLFEIVRKNVPTGNFYVACLGLKPEIAQYNGYKTIDGYFYYYPMKHKLDMMEVSKREMEKMGIDNIDNHCDVFCKELSEHKIEIKNLDLNFDKMKELNTKYMFSSVKVLSSQLVNEKVITNGTQVIFVYELI